MNKLSEVVFAIKVSELSPNKSLFNGYQTPADPEILERIYHNNVLMSRRECENDPEFKHIIPYCMITSEDNQIFVVNRTTNQTEARLHNLYSIGIGGHVGPSRFLSPKESIQNGMLRELREELIGMDCVGESFDFMPHLIGFVNDNTNSVGAVHFGFVYELLVDPDRIPTIKVKETDNMVGEWMPIEEAVKIENYESWSSLILKGNNNE